MATLHRQLLRNRFTAGWIVATALLMRLLVPAGTMLGTSHGSITVELCSGTGPMQMAIAGTHHTDSGKDHGKPDQPCPFAGLSAPALGGADPILLAIALAFVIATAFRVAIVALPIRRAFLRPPLRGPPAIS